MCGTGWDKLQLKTLALLVLQLEGGHRAVVMFVLLRRLASQTQQQCVRWKDKRHEIQQAQWRSRTRKCSSSSSS
jgi:hypothetical protein